MVWRWLAVLGTVTASVAAAGAVTPRLTDDSAALTETQRRGQRAPQQPLSAPLGAVALHRDPNEDLAAALLRLFEHDRESLRASAGRAVHDPQASAADQALAWLVLGLASDGRGWSAEPFERSQKLFRAAADPAGAQVALGCGARALATVGRQPAEQLAGQVKPQLEQLLAGPRVPLADLHGARAAEMIAERLAQRPADQRGGLDPTPWFTQAAVLATLAGGDPQQPALMRSMAANLAMQARLESRLVGGQPLELTSFADDFEAYDRTVNQTVLEQDRPAELWLSLSGLVENLGRWLQLISGKAEAEVLSKYGQRTLFLTQAALPLADDRDAAVVGAETVYGAPPMRDLQEPGMRACRVLNEVLGSQPSESLTLFAGDRKFGTFQEYAFWFLERTRSTELSRKLAEMRGTDLDQEALTRLGALQSERSSLAVQTVHAVAEHVLAKRADPQAPPTRGGTRPGPGLRGGRPDRRGGGPLQDRSPRPGDPRQTISRHRDLAAEILALELGNDDEAKETAGLLTRPLTTTDVQRLLPDRTTAVVAYGYDWSFVIGPQGVSWRTLTPPGPPRAVMQMAGLVGDLTTDVATRLQASQALYDAYLRPLATELSGMRKLLLVPSGPLSCLPFEALVTGTRTTDGALPASWSGAAVAAERYAMEYVPSLTMMAIAAARSKRAQLEPASTLLAVGDVALGDSVQLSEEGIRFVLVPTRSGAENELLALPHTGEEVRALAAAIAPRPATVLTGAAATAERVKQELDHYAILHFATHGLIADERDPLSSALLLSPGADGKPGLLTAREVYDTQLPARLAVLSACDTAAGRMRFVSGGVTSLAGAFLYAGVPHVVASLWPVDDLATSQFMAHFYAAAVAAPGTESEALQAARQALRTQDGGRWADPYYWSAFLLFR